VEGKEEDGNWMEDYCHFLEVIRLLRGHELWADPQPVPPGSGGRNTSETAT